jgi:hypothetical protein
MAIRATDDEALATELWGDDKKWDGERGQFVPVEKEVKSSPGNSSPSSQSSTEKPSGESGKNPRPTAPTTGQPSSQDPKGSSTAPSTGGSGKGNNKS